MSINVKEDCEFTILIADLINVLSIYNKGLFTLKIWLTGIELPFEFENHCDFEFMQEGIRIIGDGDVMYIFYDTIAYIRVVNESDKLKGEIECDIV